MKTCSKCNQELPATLEYFCKNGKYLRSYCKTCSRTYGRIYAKNNLELSNKRKKAWRKANLDKHKATNRKYYKNNSKKLNAAIKSWRNRNPEKVSETAKMFRKSNPDKTREKDRVQNNKRRALKLNNGHSPYTEKQVLETYGTDCNICNFPIDLNAARKVGLPGWENGLHIDHLLPISKGGPDIIENTRPTHGLCNITKNNKEQYEVQTA